MSKTNQDVCHDFFYDIGGYYMPRNMNVGYNRNLFYSYDTAIAKLVTNKFGVTVCLMSCEYFSNTTAKHLNHLRSACPFNKIEVPVGYGVVAFEPADVLLVGLNELDYWKTQKISQCKNRKSFLAALKRLKVYMENFDVVLTEEQQLLLAEYEEYSKSLLQIEAKLAEKRKARYEAKLLKEQQKRAEMEKEFQKMLKEHNYLSVVKAAYASSPYTITSERKMQLRKMLNPNDRNSFVWEDGEYYRTSQGVKVSKREGDILLKLLHKNRLQHGYKIDRYTVISVTEDAVKIGCHLIPRQNLEELYKTIAQ